MTFLARIDRASSAPVPTLITTDLDRAAEGRAMAEDMDTVLSRPPVRPVEQPAVGFWDLLGFAAGLGLLAVALAIFLPAVV
ncbi:hypothetical protein ACFOHK_08375 [Falsigemmobacter intermedius]|uniref:Uncharacterized protein n=1 Tax=Falsigemmobacter intermedius TaxID=1553448 RepID=A0A451GGP6_9RHOB|nr:hypothetical protein [Falsigemmobacter intermedius]RWY36385.1 hypothetical protein EP867_18090 [Falsigemmobacter intermedius]